MTIYQARAVENSLAVKQAEQKVAAAQARATGEHKALKWPTIDLASQYAYLAKYNNYDLYYRNYTANNFSGGLNVRFPLFNSVQKAKAEQADASALIATKQVDLTKNQVREDALKLQRSLRRLAAARRSQAGMGGCSEPLPHSDQQPIPAGEPGIAGWDVPHPWHTARQSRTCTSQPPQSARRAASRKDRFTTGASGPLNCFQQRLPGLIPV